MNTLKAEKRNMSIKAKKLRRDGFVTGNVFGKNIEGSIPLQISARDAERFLKTNTKGSQVVLQMEDQNIAALVKEIAYDSIKRQILEIDFQALVEGQKVHSVAEVVLLNHEMVTTGVLEKLLNEISYRAYPEALVEKVEIDAGKLRVGDTLKVKDLTIAADPEIDLLTDPEAIVVTVSPFRNAGTDEADSAGEATEADK